MNGDKGKFGDLEINLNHFFRYIYGGFLLCLITIILFPLQSLELYKNLGGKDMGSSVIFVIAIIAIGTGFYVWYKNLVSETVIDILHLDLLFLMFHRKEKCVFCYLKELGVRRDQLITAFRLIRDEHFKEEIHKMYYLRHSEIHVLYMTATACLIGFFTQKLLQNRITIIGEWPLVLQFVGITAFLAGVLCEMKLCADEYSYVNLIGDTVIKKTLTDAKLISEKREDSWYLRIFGCLLKYALFFLLNWLILYFLIFRKNIVHFTIKGFLWTVFLVLIFSAWDLSHYNKN